MSISNSYPTQRATLNLDFANSGKLDSRISFSRADTPPTYAAPSAVHYWSNEKHLSSENLLLQSQDFDTSWSRIHLVSSVSGGHSAPDGSSTGWLMTANTGTSQEPQLQQLFAVNSNTEYTAIAHLKAGTASHGYVSFRGGSGGHYAYAIIDFSAGTVADGGSGFTGISSSITALSDSWYKVTVTATSDSTTSSPYCFIGISDGSAFGSNGTAPYDSNGETMYAWGAQLSSTNSKVYDSPTTTQISRSYSSTLKSVSNAGAPRFEYDPTDGQSVGTPKGLLVESQASNLARYGSDVANWVTMSNVDITTNAAVAPNSELEADLVVATSAASYHYVYDNVPTITSGTVYTASVYAKNAGQRYVQFVGASNVFGLGQYATFDLQTGSVDANGVTASSENVGNGWYRIQIAMTATATGSGSAFLALANSATASRSISFTGDDYSGVLIWGFQIETGSAASSLANSGTSSSGVTRAADSCSVDLSDVGIANGQDVTLVVEGDYGDPAIKNSNRIAANLQDGTNANYVWIYNGSSNAGTGYVGNGGADQAYFPSGITAGAFKSAISAKNNLINYAANGTAGTTDTAGSVPLFSILRLGGYSSSGLELDGNLSRVALYGQALSSSELAALTSS